MVESSKLFEYSKTFIDALIEVTNDFIFTGIIPLIQKFIPGTSQCIFPTSVQMFMLFIPPLIGLYIVVMKMK